VFSCLALDITIPVIQVSGNGISAAGALILKALMSHGVEHMILLRRMSRAAGEQEGERGVEFAARGVFGNN